MEDVQGNKGYFKLLMFEKSDQENIGTQEGSLKLEFT
jgi:hypothetical protein